MNNWYTLRKRVRQAQKEKMALRDEILRLRAEREQVALRMDAVRIKHEKETKDSSVSSAAALYLTRNTNHRNFTVPA